MASEKIIFTSKQKEYLLEEFESIGNDSSIARTFKELYNDPRDVAAIRKSINRLRNKGIKQAARDAEVSTQDVKHLWLKQDGASLFIKNPDFQEGDKDQFALDLIESLKSHVPKYEKFKREKSKDGHLLVIDPCDLHIGKLASAFETGENYNSQIAVQRALEGVDGILEKCGFEIDQILFIGGNDILHIDTPDRKTTSGTPQDTDGMWYNNFLIAKKLYVDILEKLLQVANVQFTFNPSNHDYTNGFFLADVIKTHFRNCDQIQFDCSISHRKYYRYHSNLIGTTHESVPEALLNDSTVTPMKSLAIL